MTDEMKKIETDSLLCMIAVTLNDILPYVAKRPGTSEETRRAASKYFRALELIEEYKVWYNENSKSG